MFIDGLGSGGAQRQFVRLACGLAERGHRVTVAVYNELDHFAPTVRAADIDIVVLDKPSRFSPRPIVELARLYDRIGADVCIAFLRSEAIIAETARILNPSMRVIVSERSVYDEGSLPPLLRLTQGLHRLASYVVTNSSYQGRRMAQEFPQLADRTVTIHNAVARPEHRASVRSTIENGLRLLAVSSLMPYKNSILLAHALAVLRDDFGIRAQVDWLGETFAGREGYDAYGETCAALAELGLEGQWSWLGVRNDVERVMAEYDALIHPSGLEGMSNAVCEAMAIGLPVIAGPISDHAEVVGGPGAGLLFEDFEPRSIARAIADFAQTPMVRRAAMGEAGREVIATRFAERGMITQYERVIEATISGRKLDDIPDLSQGSADRCAA